MPSPLAVPTPYQTHRTVSHHTGACLLYLPAASCLTVGAKDPGSGSNHSTSTLEVQSGFAPFKAFCSALFMESIMNRRDKNPEGVITDWLTTGTD